MNNSRTYELLDNEGNLYHILTDFDLDTSLKLFNICEPFISIHHCEEINKDKIELNILKFDYIFQKP